MSFSRFAVCNACCGYTCHPFTAANIVNPVDGGPSNIAVDLFATPIASAGDFFVNEDDDGRIGDTEIRDFIFGGLYPSGFPPAGYGIAYTPRSGCPNINVGFNFASCSQNLDYQDESLIDLLACLIGKEPFNVQRDLSGSGFFDRAVYYPGFTVVPPNASGTGQAYVPPGCPCYEVNDNESAAWSPVYYTLFPSEFRPASYPSGSFTDFQDYIQCQQSYTRCVADVCNGSDGNCSSSGDKTGDHFPVDLPYCLTKFHVNQPGTPLYSGGLPPPAPIIGYNQNIQYQMWPEGCTCCFANPPGPCGPCQTSFVGQCFSHATAEDQTLGGFPNVAYSGCNHFSVPYGNTTNITVVWPNDEISNIFADPPCSQVSTPDMYKPCNCFSSETIYGCNKFHVNMCGLTEITKAPAIHSFQGLFSCDQCLINNNCEICDQPPTKSSFQGKRPLDVNLTYQYPNSSLGFNGSLTYCGSFGGSAYWPNAIDCCSALTGDLQNQRSQFSTNLQGFEPSFCAVSTGGGDFVTVFKDCFQNSISYGSMLMIGLADCANVEPFTLEGPAGFSRFPLGDPKNISTECCSADGTPLGTYTSDGADCHVPDFGVPATCGRAASTVGLFQDKSCCQLFGNYVSFVRGISFAEYCMEEGRPDCITDGNPLLINGQITQNCSGDLCNENLVCTGTDGDGNTIYTLSI